MYKIQDNIHILAIPKCGFIRCSSSRSVSEFIEDIGSFIPIPKGTLPTARRASVKELGCGTAVCFAG